MGRCAAVHNKFSVYSHNPTETRLLSLELICSVVGRTVHMPGHKFLGLCTSFNADPRLSCQQIAFSHQITMHHFTTKRSDFDSVVHLVVSIPEVWSFFSRSSTKTLRNTSVSEQLSHFHFQTAVRWIALEFLMHHGKVPLRICTLAKCFSPLLGCDPLFWRLPHNCFDSVVRFQPLR